MARFIVNYKMTISGTLIPECFNYKVIDDDSRRLGFKFTDYGCDRDLAERWYRFANGRRMWNQCAPQFSCNADNPGWLVSTHPTVWEGRVTRQVCFGKKWSTTCCSHHTYITVRNCGSFYVYGLKPSPACSLRYCTN